MTTGNADKEEYLTEAVNSICNAKEYKSSVIVVKEKESILTYNNVAELLLALLYHIIVSNQINQYLRF
jgi:bifunctional N-acetylglucosamine-1-phosphate-uridyltransferase/glucosamine-1-phosphate-acetyltransferase GlmU-like protein